MLDRILALSPVGYTQAERDKIMQLHTQMTALSAEVRAKCAELDQLRAEFTQLVTYFKPGDTVLYTGSNRPRQQYVVVDILYNPDNLYTVVCRGTTAKTFKIYYHLNPLSCVKVLKENTNDLSSAGAGIREDD